MSTQRSRSDGTQGVNEPDAVSSAIGQPVEHVQYQANLIAKLSRCSVAPCVCAASPPSAPSAMIGIVLSVAAETGPRPGEFERATCHNLGHDLDHVVLQCAHP
jgi:hypothetical protein